ncbi:uncharacterized protein LOC142158645 [Mixophyes fleayi]|uniref:uncharacterized protein LOC142158645 n=1 Tax=Mixophyes fleayi TaxID=3061075 RepID=UPI003F4DE521
MMRILVNKWRPRHKVGGCQPRCHQEWRGVQNRCQDFSSYRRGSEAILSSSPLHPSRKLPVMWRLRWIQLDMYGRGHSSQRLENATEAQNVHLALIASIVQHTDQEITSLNSTLSTFMSTHTSLISTHNSLMTTHTTQMDTLNTTLSNIATLLGDLLHAHSQRTSSRFPSPSSDYFFTSPHTQLAGASNLPIVSDSPLPVVSVASPTPVVSDSSFPVSDASTTRVVSGSSLPVSGASTTPVVSDSSLLDPNLCRLMCLAFARGFAPPVVVPSQSPVVVPSQSPVMVPSKSPVVVPSQSRVHEPAPSHRRTQSVSCAGLAGSSDSSTSRVTRSRSRTQSSPTSYKKPEKKKILLFGIKPYHLIY